MENTRYSLENAAVPGDNKSDFLRALAKSVKEGVVVKMYNKGSEE